MKESKVIKGIKFREVGESRRGARYPEGKDRAERRLSAILSADVESYSRLMNQDEPGTIRTLQNYRLIIATHVESFHGRIVDSSGDNILAEFASAVDAVEAAVEIQKDLKKRNSELPEEGRMIFRIGVNLGDIVSEGDNIYGDSVNIAARIETLSQGGGICISGTVYDQVSNKLGLKYEYLGKRNFKNLPDPISVYRVYLTPSESSPKKTKQKMGVIRYFRKSLLVIILLMILAVTGIITWQLNKPSEDSTLFPGNELGQNLSSPSQEIPSIAVLPFINMADPGQDYLINGITENIITVLSKTPGLLVINQNALFLYKEKEIDIKTVARELGVGFILQGSLQQFEDQIRISTQLINTENGELLWAERYDRTVQDIFALQDEITLKIITALNIRLTKGERSGLLVKGTDNLNAYLKLLQGMELMRSKTPMDNLKAREIAEEVISLDPGYAGGYILQAMTYLREARGESNTSSSLALDRAYQLAQDAIKIDPDDVMAHMIKGNVYLRKDEFEKAITEWEAVVSINSNSSEGLLALGRIRLWEGKPEEAISLFEEVQKREPFPGRGVRLPMGRAYFFAGKPEKALLIFQNIADKHKDNIEVLIDSIACHAEMGQLDEARVLADRVLQINPDFTIAGFTEKLKYQDPSYKKKYIELLRNTGLK